MAYQINNIIKFVQLVSQSAKVWEILAITKKAIPQPYRYNIRYLIPININCYLEYHLIIKNGP